MMALADEQMITTSQAKILILDECVDVYNQLYPQFDRHFVLERIPLEESHSLSNAVPPDGVVVIAGKAQYPYVIQWLHHIRQYDAWQYIPIIPYINMPEETLFLNAGATECWVHPISSDAMITRMKNHLDRVKQLHQYRRQLQEYRQAYLAQSHLIEIASHDLQHPINDLLMIEGLLQQHAQHDTHIKALLEDMNVALDTIQEALNDFLTALYVRSEAQFNPQYMSVSNILLDIGLKYTLRAASKNIQITVGQTEAYLYADPRRLRQIVENLVSNAVKYSPPNKQVHIWSEVAPQGTYIRVRDWGPGIPPEERNLLFSEFGRLSTQPTGNEGSIGLGLWVVNWQKA
jgi:signal transduction histidine kinase